MSLNIHPILNSGDRPSKGIWYAIAPESSTEEEKGREGPCPRVGSSASSYVKESEYYSTVLVSAGATFNGPYSDLHQLCFSTSEYIIRGVVYRRKGSAGYKIFLYQ